MQRDTDTVGQAIDFDRGFAVFISFVCVPNNILAGLVDRQDDVKCLRRGKPAHFGGAGDTGADQFQAILTRIRNFIADDERVDHDVTEMVHITEFQDSSIAINLYYFTKTTDWVMWRDIIEEHMLAFLAIIEEEGSAMAFPTRTIQIEGEEFSAVSSQSEG